jgi:hypothetical protein
MNKDLHFIPECYVDTNLVETLLSVFNTPVAVNHQKGCNTVANTMIKKLHDDFAVGIIDNDKQKHSYTLEFVEIGRSEHLVITKHKQRPHFFIIINPAMECFILDVADRKQINMSDFDLQGEISNFKKDTKCVSTKEDPNFKKLFKALKDDDEFKLLGELLEYFHREKCKAKSDIIKSILKKY